MDKEMQAKHKGFVEKRTWHKIKWISGKYVNKFDLFDDSDLAKHKKDVEIIETFKTEMCTAGVPFGFGQNTEEKIDAWIKQNRR